MIRGLAVYLLLQAAFTCLLAIPLTALNTVVHWLDPNLPGLGYYTWVVGVAIVRLAILPLSLPEMPEQADLDD